MTKETARTFRRRAPASDPARPEEPAMKLSLPLYLRDVLKSVVRETEARAVLLSGGLDTSVLAHLLAKRRGAAGITVAVDGKSPDRPFAESAARLNGLAHVVVAPGFEELLGVLPQTIRILKTYDPTALRNALAAHVGLLAAKEMKLSSVITGDGADELFAGYGFFVKTPAAELPAALRRLWKIMRFDAVEIGRRLGVTVETPYLHPLVREFAEKVPAELLVAERGGEVHGKAVLRRAFDGEIPDDLLWRRKTPAEAGSGTAGLARFVADRVSDEEQARQTDGFLRSDGVALRDKEHLYYYRLYRSQFGPPKGRARGEKSGERACPDCGTPPPAPEADSCALCGAWPVP